MAAAVARGEDPAAARARERGELTFGGLADLYFERHARPRKRSARQDERMLRDVLGRPGKEPALIPATWRNRRLSDLTREAVAELHARVGRDSGHYAANRGLALLRTMFNLARVWGLYSGDNPATGIRAFHEERRDRFLGPDELSRALVAIDQEPDWRWRAYFRLALLLGPRKQELLRVQWPELDVSARPWRLPMIGRVLNHSQPSATAVYARLDLEPVRRALEANAQAMLEVERSAAVESAKNMPGSIHQGGRSPERHQPKRKRREQPARPHRLTRAPDGRRPAPAD